MNDIAAKARLTRTVRVLMEEAMDTAMLAADLAVNPYAEDRIFGDHRVAVERLAAEAVRNVEKAQEYAAQSNTPLARKLAAQATNAIPIAQAALERTTFLGSVTTLSTT